MEIIHDLTDILLFSALWQKTTEEKPFLTSCALQELLLLQTYNHLSLQNEKSITHTVTVTWVSFTKTSAKFCWNSSSYSTSCMENTLSFDKTTIW